MRITNLTVSRVLPSDERYPDDLKEPMDVYRCACVDEQGKEFESIFFAAVHPAGSMDVRMASDMLESFAGAISRMAAPIAA